MSSEQSDQTTSLSPEIWKTLEGVNYWGAKATELQKLNKVKNFQEPFKHTDICLKDNSMGDADAIMSNNPHMHLKDLRYGAIDGVAASKPSVWLIVRHEKEPTAKSQISHQGLFRPIFVILGGSGGPQEIVNRLLPVVIHSTVEIESDTYALLGMHEELGNEDLLYPWLNTSLEDKETFVVRLKNSKSIMDHQHCNWTSGP
jgi:hypothetical protein